MNKFCLALILLSLTSLSFAGTDNFSFSNGNIAMLAPPAINKDYYLVEFGFITEKKFKSYNYNAFVTGALFEDWMNQEHRLRAGALGFKAGVMAPTQPWIPLLFTLSTGFAKTALHTNPLFGRDDQAVSKKTMFFLEAGLLYRYDKYFLRLVYQKSNVAYFHRHLILLFGVSY